MPENYWAGMTFILVLIEDHISLATFSISEKRTNP